MRKKQVLLFLLTLCMFFSLFPSAVVTAEATEPMP